MISRLGRADRVSAILICDGDTGTAGTGRGDKPNGKKRKPPPQFGAIALNPVPVNGQYKGSTTAGYATKGKARMRALRRCAADSGGACAVKATARNGWAVLVAAAGSDGIPRFFSGTGRTQFSAQDAAERRARQALGADLTGQIKLVVGVDTRARKRR